MAETRIAGTRVGSFSRANKENRILARELLNAITTEYYRDKYKEEKKVQIAENQKWLKVLMESFKSEFATNDFVLEVCKNVFAFWEKTKFRRDFSLAPKDIRDAMVLCSQEDRLRFEKMLNRVRTQYEAEKRE